MYLKVFKLKKILFFFILLVLFLILYYLLLIKISSLINLDELKLSSLSYKDFNQMKRLKNYHENQSINGTKLKKLYKEIDCVINDEYNINCLKSVINQTIYLPFPFIKKYFDVFGKLEENKLINKEIFNFQHSYSKIYSPLNTYDFKKNFLWFENYNVENRDRVKYISGLYNVPISTQWNTSGHFYPIQIAQFGLSHFNKFLFYPNSKNINIEINDYLKYNSSLNELNLYIKNNSCILLDRLNDEKVLKKNKTLSFNLRKNRKKNLNKSIEKLNTTTGISKLKNLTEKSSLEISTKKYKLENLNEESKIENSTKAYKLENIAKKYKLENVTKEYKLENVSIEKNFFVNKSNLVINLFYDQKYLNNYQYLSFNYKCINEFKVTVFLKNDKNKFKVYYKNLNKEIFKNENLVYGVGNCSKWSTFNRNLGIDLIKSVNLLKKNSETSIKIRKLRIFKIIFSGNFYINNLKIFNNNHFGHFNDTVNWLILNQDNNGGWPISTSRKLVSFSMVLKKNWYSAMAQGQAISLLTRMFHFNENSIKNLIFSNQSSYLISKNNYIYLDAAIKGIELFKKNVSQKGIKTYFMDKYVWFEEYPTKPSLFVLNGFIYSLFGLYDLKMTLKSLKIDPTIDEIKKKFYYKKYLETKNLFDDGIISLKKLLPLFDTGSSSLYDLRHFTLNISPNIARWDYHTTHINLLLQLNTILNDSTLDNCIYRWIDYMKGKKAAHN